MLKQAKRLKFDCQTIRILDTVELRTPTGGAPKTEKTCSCTDNPIISCCP
jgi:hypothetical protein